MAQAPPANKAQDGTSLAIALDAAWQRSVGAREADGLASRARAEQDAAGSRWAAPLAVELSQRIGAHNATGQRETEVGVVWPLWLPGQQGARVAAASADAAFADATFAAARLRLAGEVREAGWAVYTQQTEVALVNAQAKTLLQLADDVDRRVTAGDLARADAMAARAEVLAASAMQVDARLRFDIALLRWTLLTGLDTTPDVRESAAATVAEKAATANADLSTHPEVQAAMAGIERSRRALDVARRTQGDPPELTLRVREDMPGGGNAARRSIGVSIRVPFGTTNLNRPKQAAAQSELDVAQTTADRTRERLATEVSVARVAVQASERQAEAERTRTALLQERARLIEMSFKAGETALPDLLRALTVAAQAEASHVRQIAALGLNRARLYQALGVLP
ncbi:MAG: TolC family protein [Burkholderiales bacterium]|nr:MAG: TolC family protein [Burkholderiales bacterium]TAG78411.1 MAG: TolC family protein [Betaproteobacteria bacterium]